MGSTSLSPVGVCIYCGNYQASARENHQRVLGREEVFSLSCLGRYGVVSGPIGCPGFVTSTSVLRTPVSTYLGTYLVSTFLLEVITFLGSTG
jgi:hypothetical protein